MSSSCCAGCRSVRLSGGGDFRNGRTPFDKLNIALQIVQGTATIEDVHLEGPNVKLGLTGTTSIPAREFDLAGTASLTNAAADAGVAFELPFIVQGPWDDPVMLPDAQTLIKRSVRRGTAARCGARPQDPRRRRVVDPAADGTGAGSQPAVISPIGNLSTIRARHPVAMCCSPFMSLAVTT